MQEFKLVLPLVDNKGFTVCAAHQYLTQRLCEICGGFTALDGIGGWRTAGKTVVEAVRVYSVASGNPIQDSGPLLAALLKAGAMARQEAVYFVSPNDGASIVDCRANSLAA